MHQAQPYSYPNNFFNKAALCACRNAREPDAVTVTNLIFAHNQEPALDHVNLTVHQGDFVALIGPNGGGKTTLLRLMLGLLSPQSGSIRIFGKNPKKANAQTGYVPQFSTMKTDVPAKVLDIVLMGAAERSILGGSWPKDGKARKRALELLETLGLADLAAEPLYALSGGQRQRIMVARALMGRPAKKETPFLLLLDEPTASIDPQGKFCFYEFLGTLRGDVTIIVVSHDLFVASPFFNHVVFINKTATAMPEHTPLTGENLTALFGAHMHACPIADLQHADDSSRSGEHAAPRHCHP